MRGMGIFLVLAGLAAAPAQAGGDQADFALVLKQCVPAGGVSFGPQGRWAECRLEARDWVVTIDPLDFYQVQYCLGGSGGECERRAWLLFANRAYHPAARLVLERMDPGATRYEPPLVVRSGRNVILELAAAAPGAPAARSHYLWQGGRWVPVENRAWLRELAPRLPRGTSLRPGVTPEAETMSARAPLYRAGDAECCPSGGVAEVGLGLAKGRFTVKSVKLEPAGG